MTELPIPVLHAPQLDVADLAALAMRFDEAARLAAFAPTPATRRDLPADFVARHRDPVVHRDPDQRAHLLRAVVSTSPELPIETVRTVLVGRGSFHPFVIDEPLLADGSNDPADASPHAPASQWFARLAAIARDARDRVSAHGMRAGDPYHEIGQTLAGMLSVRVAALAFRDRASGSPDDFQRRFVRLVAPSPYGPLDAVVMMPRLQGGSYPVASLDPTLRDTWSSGLGSTVQADVERGHDGSGTEIQIRLSAPSQILRRLVAETDPVDAMRAIRAFPAEASPAFLPIARRPD